MTSNVDDAADGPQHDGRPSEEPAAPGLRVEALAAEAGISVDTVRYYQKLGLLHPPARQGRVALYDETHLERIATIRRLSDEGFSLSQIERLLDGESDPLFGTLQAADRTISFDELVQRSGFDESIVSLAIDAGLVRATANDADRYPVEALTMLSAGSALLGAGLPLEELLGLSMRHAEHVETVVDEAIELFQRHLEPSDRDRRADIVADLIPKVSDLVAGHFRQTLIDRASVRLLGRDDETRTPAASDGGQPGTKVRIDAVRRRLGDPEAAAIDPLEIYAAAEGLPRQFWTHPDAGVTIVAIGEAFTIDTDDPAERFAEVSAGLGSLAIEIDGGDAPPEAGPLLIGGVTFSDQHVRGAPDWRPFGAAHLVLPSLLVARTPEGTFVTTAGDDDLSHLLEGRPVGNELGAFTPAGHHNNPAYERLVTQAIEAIHAGEFDKVVTARTITFPAKLDPAVLLDRLRDRYPDCVTFAISAGDRVFLGASPERLVARHGTRVETAALAASRPRGATPAADDALRAELLASPKEQSEHRMVVDDIRQTLARVGVTLDPDEPTGVMQLRRIQHLFTPITGTMTDVASSLDLVAALHPTPAVAGLPRRPSQQWIDANEGFDRGWYAAPIGWTTPDGTGEFRVGLRSALLGPDDITLFSGAGIVDGSDPKAELAETAVKFEALLGAMGVTE